MQGQQSTRDICLAPIPLRAHLLGAALPTSGMSAGAALVAGVSTEVYPGCVRSFSPLTGVTPGEVRESLLTSEEDHRAQRPVVKALTPAARDAVGAVPLKIAVRSRDMAVRRKLDEWMP